MPLEPQTALQDLISHEEAISHINLVAAALGVEIPTDERHVRFFLVRLKEAIQNNQLQ